jgi:alpha-amylase/alpha-mannosidase (GH57 family)
MTVALVVHGHFYQPPRENPWTELVDPEPGARPFNDWNERVHAECYRPNAHARISDQYGRVERIVNNYSNLSFNFGPTLLAWLQRLFPDTYARVLEADRASARRLRGHGNAVAQGFHHAILPLCNDRDRRTQIRWGLADFRLRFRREPESLWLPETACDEATLDALIEEGLKYVILSPSQAGGVRPLGSPADWRDVSGGGVDTTIPYSYQHSDKSGRSLAVFFYDSQIARAVAFESLLASSQSLVSACARAAERGGAQLINVATDGESYGHHFRFGDRSIAYALEEEAARRGLRVTNYGEFLEENEPAFEVRLMPDPEGRGTAWSCPHGLGRWTRDCGCHASAPEGWNQSWRAPLREALDFLRDRTAQQFEDAGGDLFTDPWAARDAYVELLVDRTASREEFFRSRAARPLSRDDEVRALTLLEAQRMSLAMYASCGWFFNDISGIETLQTLRHAARAVELSSEAGLEPPLGGFVERLAEARSNLSDKGNGADIFLRAAGQSRVTPRRVAAHLAISDLIEGNGRTNESESAGYLHRRSDFQKRRHGRVTLETGRLALEELSTGRRQEFALAAMHFGEIDYYCALRPFTGPEAFRESEASLWSHFRTASLPVLLRVAQEQFGPEEFGLEALLPQGQGSLSASVFGKLTERVRAEYEHLYEENRRVVERLQEIGFQAPRELLLAAELTLSRRIERELCEQRNGAGDYATALELAREAARFGYRVDRSTATRVFEETINEAARTFVARPTEENTRAARALIALGHELGLEANLERAQEIIYEAVRTGMPLSEEARDFALALGLAPVALVAQAAEPSTEPPRDENLVAPV